MRFIVDTEKETVELIDTVTAESKDYYTQELNYFFTKKRFNFFKIVFNFSESPKLPEKVDTGRVV